MKSPSGRKYSTVATVTTFCLAFLSLTAALIFGRIDAKLYAGFFAAFGIVVGKIIDFYFLAKRNGENISPE